MLTFDGGPPFYVEAHPPEAVRSLFTGRNRELSLLDEMLLHANGSPVVVVGMSGSGRTTLCRAYVDWRGERYAGVIFCPGQRFRSADALIEYIAYERALLAAGASAPMRERRDGRPLLVIDDADCFRPSEIGSLLAVSQLRHPGVVPLLTSRGRFPVPFPFATDTHEVRLGALTEADVEALLAKRVTTQAATSKQVEQFLAAAHREGLSLDQLTPRLVLELFYHRELEGSDLKTTLARLVEFLVAPSNIVVFEHEGRLRAAPALQGELAGLIAAAQPPLFATPYIVIPHLAAIWRAQLEEFEALLADTNSDEGTFQRFFESNAHFLQGVEYDRVVAHASLIREGDGPLIPDFMLQPLNSKYANILDLKRPDASLVTGSKDRRRFAHGVHEAVAQVREYREYFAHPEHRRAVEKRYGLTAYYPAALIVIGRQPKTVSAEEMKRIEGDVPNFVTIQTYDDILRMMRRMVELKER